MHQKEWLLLNFTLPKEPSRVRVSVWRKLKKCGSINIGQSMWVLPLSDKHMKTYSELSKYILENNGEAYVLKSTFISAGRFEDVAEIFNKDRNEEYKEFLEKCSDFLQEIEKETKKENFSFAEIEENKYEYKKLEKWINKIIERDFFNSPLKKESIESLKNCEQVLDNYRQLCGLATE